MTMQSEMKTDKYNDVRTLLDYAFDRYTGYTDLPSQLSLIHICSGSMP